ncbi:GntR family transcriptional regulator [Microlunatus soli]|uniref:DNA-binding transcriptional regulator, GntR family n=1 Tax=Microlunatus soli TaxID=630515 RepID=A0A1H1TMS5_9ACTN|nr:GntR family transcriptional regulator [Microlunatus soli]SDS61361.1 DNA-binding transcriptional regulator, GntR family [Microlunatus soli]
MGGVRRAPTGPRARYAFAATGTELADDPLAELTVLVPPHVHADSHAAVAYYLIRDLVVTLELAPGSPLNERILMERLNLGRTPVREALRRLADEGLVAIFPRRGMVVAPIHVHDLSSISEVRIELEGLAAGLAARRRTADDRRVAADLLERLAVGVDPSDPRGLIRLDQQVHHLVHRATHNDYLQNTLAEYLALSLRLWFLGLERVHRLDQAVGEHRDLLTAITAGDADIAAATARAHVTAFWQQITQVL